MEDVIYDALLKLSDDSDNDTTDNEDDDANNNTTTEIEIPVEIDELINKENPNGNKKYSNPKSINKNYVPRLDQVEIAKVAGFIGSLTKEQLKHCEELKNLSKRIDNIFVRKAKYTNQREILDGRNSYSKTDIDASFMRLKNDSFDSKILSPAYNVQMATCDEFVLGSLLSNSAGDTRLLPDVMNMLESLEVKEQMEQLLVDPGYGSLENYTYLDEHGIEYLIPHMLWRYESKRKYKNNPTTIDKFYRYSPEAIICPEGRTLELVKEITHKSPSGFETHKQAYKCHNCSNCPLREQCLKKKSRY